MVSPTKIQRRRKSKGGRWTPELRKKLYDSRNKYSHLSWEEFHRKNIFPGRSSWALQKAFSTYKLDLRVERRTKRMQATASAPKPSLYPPNTPVLKRPLQAEKEPRLRNRKQPKLNTSLRYNSTAIPGSKEGVQGPSLDPSNDSNSEGEDILPSGRTEEFPKSAQRTKINKRHNASPSTLSTASRPRAAPNTAKGSVSRPGPQSRSGSQLSDTVTTLYYGSKHTGDRGPDSPASAQSTRSASQAQQPSQEETIPAQSVDTDAEKLCEIANSLKRRTTEWNTDRQNLEAENSRFRTLYSSLQTEHSTLKKGYDATQKFQSHTITCQATRIEQLCEENARLHEKSCGSCLKMRESLLTKEKELAKSKNEVTEKNKELAEMKNEVTEKNKELAERNEDLVKMKKELSQKDEWKSMVENAWRSYPPA